nr:MAG TPA: hypothetical protein [Caudoviricetes sp.]
MKQIIKDYLYLKLGIIVLAIIIAGGAFPIMYIDNVLFAILYLVIIYPLIMLGVYKIAVILNAKTGKL